MDIENTDLVKGTQHERATEHGHVLAFAGPASAASVSVASVSSSWSRTLLQFTILLLVAISLRASIAWAIRSVKDIGP